jgi:hypothetical protein
VAGNEAQRRVADALEHGRGRCVKERHAVGLFVADGDTVVTVGVLHLHARQRSPVVAEVVLDGRVVHLEIVKLEHKVDQLGKLLGERLFVCLFVDDKKNV